MFRAYQRCKEEEIMAKVPPKQVQLKTIIFLGSTREGRMGLRAARFMKAQLEEAKHVVEIFDPLEMPFEIMTKALHHYPDRSQAPKWLRDANQKILDADAIVVVSAEYNHSIPPALSNMMDHFPGATFAFKPSAIVCYSVGPYGGMRAAMQLRSFLGELGCNSVSNIFGIPVIQNALDEQGKPLNEQMVPGAKKLIAQLDWFAWAIKDHKKTHDTPN